MHQPKFYTYYTKHLYSFLQTSHNVNHFMTMLHVNALYTSTILMYSIVLKQL